MFDEEDILKRTFCLELTEFPDATEDWLDERAKSIGRELLDRLRGKLEWAQVVTMPTRKGIGLAMLFFRGCEQSQEVVDTVLEVICEKTDIQRAKKRGGKLTRVGGLPQFGLGPRFPAEFYETKGRSAGPAPALRYTL